MGGSTAAESDQSFRFVRHLVCRNRVGGKVAGPALIVGQGLVGAVVFARADGQAVFGGAWWCDRIGVNLAVAILIAALVTRREANQHVAVLVNELIHLERLMVIDAKVASAAPRVGVNPCLVVGVGLIEQVVEIVGQTAQATLRVENRLQHQSCLRCGATDVALGWRHAVAQYRTRDVCAVPVRVIADAWSSQPVEFFDPILEGRVDIGSRAFVKAGVSYRHDLAKTLIAAWVGAGHAQDLAGDTVV